MKLTSEEIKIIEKHVPLGLVAQIRAVNYVITDDLAFDLAETISDVVTLNFMDEAYNVVGAGRKLDLLATKIYKSFRAA